MMVVDILWLYLNNIMNDSTEALSCFMKLIPLAFVPHGSKQSNWSMNI